MASESNNQLTERYDEAISQKSRLSEAALKWEKLAHDHYTIIQSEEMTRSRETKFHQEIDWLTGESSEHFRLLEEKSSEMVLVANSEQEQHDLFIIEAKEAHSQRIMSKLLHEEVTRLEACLDDERGSTCQLMEDGMQLYGRYELLCEAHTEMISRAECSSIEPEPVTPPKSRKHRLDSFIRSGDEDRAVVPINPQYILSLIHI